MGAVFRARMFMLLVLLPACPKDVSRGSTQRDEVVVPTPTPAPGPSDPGPFRPSTVALRTDAVIPATLDWAHPVVTRRTLEQDLARGAPPKGKLVVSFQHGGWESYDADAQALAFRLHGLEGMDLDPPVVFIPAPSIMVGSLPGPMGGSVTLHVSDLQAATSIARETADALRVGDTEDPVVTQFLIELGEKATTSEGADYWNARLLGVRLVRMKERSILLEGTPRDRAR